MMLYDALSCSAVHVGGGPPTPLSPFNPHGVEFPPTAANFSVRMERGFVVLTKIPNVEPNSLVSIIKLIVYQQLIYVNSHCKFYSGNTFNSSYKLNLACNVNMEQGHCFSARNRFPCLLSFSEKKVLF